MCGILGAVGSSRSVERLREARELLHHRGPDSGGDWVSTEAYLGVRRLRVIDLVTGDQPFANEDGSVHAVFNGEIYNFARLRRELEAHGHRFHSATDTEVLVHGYEVWGDHLPEHLEGMFAFGIWDEHRRRLLLARDRLGKKPLLYMEGADGSLTFASEFRALLHCSAAERRLELEALPLYLAFGYIPAPLTAFPGVRKLLPAHRLIYENGRSRCERYWEPPELGTSVMGEAEACERLTALLAESVRERMVADVPIGAYLSGGVDSSLVVALMARETSARVRTFTIGFDERDYSELEHARRVAERYDTDHHELVLRPDLAEAAPLLARHYGEPFADSSALPTYYLAKLTRADVTVALNGDGGDEAFAGYDRYRAMALAGRFDAIPAALRRPLLAVTAAAVPGPRTGRGLAPRARRFLRGAARDTASRYLAWTSVFSEADITELLEPAARRRDEHPLDWVERAMSHRGSTAERANRADLERYLPDDLLVKVDIASMASSLEVRSPLLDRRVIEFGASLPLDLKLRGGTGKYILKKVAEPLVPAANLRRRKMGFGVPVGEWLRGPLGALLVDTVLSTRALGRGLFRPVAVRALVAEHRAGWIDHGPRLWSLLMLELWHREFIDGN